MIEPSARGCESCRELRDWDTAHGPDGIVQRIVGMLGLAGQGSFEELHPRHIDGYYKDCVPWSEVDPKSYPELFPDGPGPGRGLPNLAPLIALRCKLCDRTFVQRWIWERGHESWTITAVR